MQVGSRQMDQPLRLDQAIQNTSTMFSTTVMLSAACYLTPCGKAAITFMLLTATILQSFASTTCFLLKHDAAKH